MNRQRDELTERIVQQQADIDLTDSYEDLLDEPERTPANAE